MARNVKRDPALGFGVVGGLDRSLLEALAREVASLGYGVFWINDGGRPGADGLAGLAVVAEAAPTLDLGVGVVPLDRRTPADIARRVTELALPLDRLRLGVGSGGARTGTLRLVRDGVGGLRDLLPNARIFISALGPRMSRLAGEVADGVLFNWAVPERLVEVSALVDEGAAAAGRARPERWAYVRAAVGPGARERIAQEARTYARSGPYGRAFEAMGRAWEEFGVADGDLTAQLRPYRAVLDGVVVRALPPEWTLEHALAIARAAAPDPRQRPT